jgi:hypothetical protein
MPELDAPLDAMEREHSGRARLAGVSPSEEWRAVMEAGGVGGGPYGGPASSGGRCRMPDWRALLAEEESAAREGGGGAWRLTAEEIVATILYTGPMVRGAPTATAAPAAQTPTPESEQGSPA